VARGRDQHGLRHGLRNDRRRRRLNWCEERGIAAGSAKALSDALVDRGFARKRKHGGLRGFVGLDLSMAGNDPDDWQGDTW
jgi:hypothetical protein